VTRSDTTLGGWKPLQSSLLSLSRPTLASPMLIFLSAVIMRVPLVPSTRDVAPTSHPTCASDVQRPFYKQRIFPSHSYMLTPVSTWLIPSPVASYQIPPLVFPSAYPFLMNSLPSLPILLPNSEAPCLDSTEIHKAAVVHLDGCICIPCKPCKDTLIISSSHHLHVLASEHVLLWTMPHGFNFQHELEQLFPESDILKMFFVTIQSLDENTCSNYGMGLLWFTQYCDQCLIPEMQHMPASVALISAFIADSAGSISDSTASNWLAGLHFWHTINGAIWNGTDSALLHHIKQGLTHCLTRI
jgi:hypothetical protein